MYAILDIETTGGKYNEEGITEIAIYKFDGHQIVDQFFSLVNPEKNIQPFVINLTGINNQMLRNAPKFHEVAKRIIEITDNCIIVAHNAQFDNRILSTEFDRLGYPFEKNMLCTVELSKKLIPDLPSYSLGKLVRSLGIPITDRHRAQGDAKATLELFKLLLEKDIEKVIISDTIKKDPKRQLEPKLLDIIESAPTNTGVYYMHRKNGKIIYVGKSKNIKKRLIQHFTNDNKKSKKIQLEVVSVSYEETGNDLIAQLKESQEIKQLKPIFNHALKNNIFQSQLYSYIDKSGYINLKIEKVPIEKEEEKNIITTFTNYQQGRSFLYKITDDFHLCQKLNHLEKTEGSCFNHDLKMCNGACIQSETSVNYNIRVQQFIDKSSYEFDDMLLIDKGRSIEEHSVILIENGIYKGYGFFNLNFQINNPEVLKSIINVMENNRDTQHIIQSYLRKNKVQKILKLE
ncbi:MAG: exonuclease domain-containing protein [Flavobacteriaceae bacterium]|nr:exonuclease domain-containing protein [Flavobacteriaceae bacterium]